MASDPRPLSADDLALLERLAARIVELHLEVPAILTLETGKPLSLLASQAMIFFEPIAQALFPGADYRRYAALAERRDAIEVLITNIETCSERARAERRAAHAGRQRPR